MAGRSGPVTVANLTAAAGVVETEDGWWPSLSLTWRTPVPPTVTRLVAQVREKGRSGPVAETVVTPGDGSALIVHGVAVGQHLQVRLAPAGAPSRGFQPTPWVDVTTPWDSLIAELQNGLKLGCFTIICGEGVPTRSDLPVGSLYIREDESQLWRYVGDAGATTLDTLTLSNADFETGDMTGWTVSDASVVTITAGGVGDDDPHGGTYCASGGTVTPTTFYQDIDVSAYAAQIDAGSVFLSGFAAYHATFDSQTDHGRLEAVFLDSVDAEISTAATAYSSPNAWTREALAATDVPSGTRTIRLGTRNVRDQGTNNDNYWDDFVSPTLVSAGGAGWVLMSDLSSVRVNGEEVASLPRAINFEGEGVTGAADDAGGVTITIPNTELSYTALKAGKVSYPIMAGAMTARTTNGAAEGATESSTNKVMSVTLDFDASTAEYAQFAIPMPRNWDEGTVSAQFYWAASNTGSVVWGLQGVAISNDDAIDAAFGTAVNVTDSVTAAGDLMISDETSAITIAGTPAAGDLVVFQVYRDAASGSDTLSVDAKLLAVKLFINLDAPDESDEDAE